MLNQYCRELLLLLLPLLLVAPLTVVGPPHVVLLAVVTGVPLPLRHLVVADVSLHLVVTNFLMLFLLVMPLVALLI